MKLQTSTLAVFVAAVAVWVDGSSAWWSRTIVTASLAVCIVVDVIRARRLGRAEQ